MFGKKCRGCGEKIGNKYNFCPYCGNSAKTSKQKDFGMLGENDFDELDNLMGNSFFGKMVGKMFENTMKMMEKEMQKEMKKSHQHQPRSNFQLFINGKKVNVDNLQNKHADPEAKKEEITSVNLPNQPLKNFSKFPRKEPKTNVRRLSDKVIYEISMPGVKSEKDISIVNLENSIEIRGIGNKVSYQKIMPINLQIADYNISKGKLILELNGE